jgi:hypothetical protein
MQSLSFPHRFDRYRLISIIFQHLRKRSPNSKQKDIEETTGLDQTTISRLLSPNSMRIRAKLKRKLNRKHLLALSRKGFGLDHRQASLILWLAEGLEFRPWRDAELRHLQILPPNTHIDIDLEQIRDVNIFRSDPQKAHAAAIELLKEVFLVKPSDDGWHKIKTNILHGIRPEDLLALYRRLNDMEYRGGQRMLVSQYPSILVSTEISSTSKRLQETPEPIRSQLREIFKNRQATFDLNLRKFGERAIHSVTSIKRFVNPNFKHSLHPEERRKRVRGLIEHLERYELFQVGLIPETEPIIEPEIEIAVKSTREAVVRGTTRELSNHPKTIVCGPSYLHWDDEWAVITFYLDFEKEWAKLQMEGNTDKEKVLETLKGILRPSRPRGRRSYKGSKI